MNNIIKLQSALVDLDSFTQLSILGSWQFIINAACINAAMRYVPDEPVENGIEEFTQYEAARRSLLRDAEESGLPALLALQRDLTGMTLDANGQARGIESTFEFLTQDSPKRSRFEEEFEMRRRMGMKPAMTKAQFVDYEYERAMNQHNLLVTRGEHAVRLCDTVTIGESNKHHHTWDGSDGDRSYGDLPDWVAESFETKMIEKLHARWEKLELVRTNPRRKKQIRDSAYADQIMIAKLLAKYDEAPGFGNEDETEEDYNDRLAGM